MEVTRTNFETIYPEIIEDIESAAFVSIDGEFTGLNNGLHINPFETPEDTYLKIRSGSVDFLLIQLGLSIFIRDGKTGEYKNKTYVFYLFPFNKDSFAPDPRFVCQSSSINFLISNNFDFNKLFKEGIPYVNSTQEIHLIRAHEEGSNMRIKRMKAFPAQPKIPKAHKAAVDDAMKKIEKVIQKEEDEVIIENLNYHTRNLVRESFMYKYGEVTDVFLNCRKNFSLICRRSQDCKKIESAVGFSRIIRKLSSKGCLVVGHNMLLDVCHIVNRFMDPIPPDYQTFKEMVRTLFPRLVDTKLISSEPLLKDRVGSTTLKNLAFTMSKPPFRLPFSIEEVDGYSYKKGGQLHDAGYDAYLTGKVFLSLVRAIDPSNKTCDTLNCKPLEKYINKLYLMKSPDTCIDLINSDPVPNRKNVFHLSFPEYWSSVHIANACSPFGRVQLFNINDTTAWILIEDEDQVKKVLELEARLRITVTPYDRFVNDDKSKKRPAKPEPVFRKKMKTKEGGASPIHKESRKEFKESAIKKLEDAASFKGGTFELNTSWD